MEMSQSHYLKNVLEKFGMDQCKPRFTPCEIKPTVYTNTDIEEIPDNDDRKYRER